MFRKPRGIDRLLDEVESPALHRSDGGVDSAHPRKQDDRDLLRGSGDLLQQLHAVHARHLQVGDHDRRPPRLDFGKPSTPSIGGICFVAPSPNQFGKAGSLILLVFDDQYFFLDSFPTATS